MDLGGSVDGVIWPNHYSDASVKNPERKFRPDASVRCRVRFPLVIETVSPAEGNLQIIALNEEKDKVILTLKKSLINSQLAVPRKFLDFKVGIDVDGTILKISDAGLVVDLWGHKAWVPIKETK
jgi:rRNA biogenesis protein RRP5